MGMKAISPTGPSNKGVHKKGQSVLIDRYANSPFNNNAAQKQNHGMLKPMTADTNIALTA